MTREELDAAVHQAVKQLAPTPRSAPDIAAVAGASTMQTVYALRRLEAAGHVQRHTEIIDTASRTGTTVVMYACSQAIQIDESTPEWLGLKTLPTFLQSRRVDGEEAERKWRPKPKPQPRIQEMGCDELDRLVAEIEGADPGTFQPSRRGGQGTPILLREGIGFEQRKRGSWVARAAGKDVATGRTPLIAGMRAFLLLSKQQKQTAREFVLDLLAAGPMTALEVMEATAAAGRHWGAIRSAALRSGVVRSKQGKDGGWLWSAPKGSEALSRSPSKGSGLASCSPSKSGHQDESASQSPIRA